MATTKSVVVQSDNVTLTAAAGDTTATGTDLTNNYGDTMLIKITNGATGPTIAGQAQVEVSGDNTNYFKHGGPLVGGTSNNGISSWTVQLSKDILYARTVSGSNTGQDVTLRVEITQVDTVDA